MKHLILSLIVSFSFCAISQEKNHYTRKNKKALKYAYTSKKCYSRSIKVEDSLVFLGNSNGSLIKYNILTGKSSNLMEGHQFQEMRDIELVDNTILGLQSGSDGLLAKATHQKFEKYILQENNQWTGLFLDGMDFYENIGFLMGDPKNGYFSLFYSVDSGETWKPCPGKIRAKSGEAGFAASGTNVQVLNDSTFIFVSGGKVSRSFISRDRGSTWKINTLPYMVSESSGAFSVHFINDSIGVVVGGDYANPKMKLNNSYYTEDGGEFWINSEKQVNGYRSSVVFANEIWYACGPNGIDFSKDNGKTWNAFAHGKYFAMTTNDANLYATMLKGFFSVFKLIK